MNGLSLFNIFLTMLVYIGAKVLYRHFPNPFTTPVLTSTIAIILILRMSDISFIQYTPAKEFLTFLLGPATVSLAVPMYKYHHVIKEKASQTLLGLMIGSLATIVSAILILKLFNLSPNIQSAAAVKAVTTPVAIEIMMMIGGDPSLAAIFVIATGIFGAAFGPVCLSLCKIDDPFSRGLGIGTVSHGIGTSQVMVEGQLQGAVSSVAMGAVAIFTSIILPIIFKLIN